MKDIVKFDGETFDLGFTEIIRWNGLNVVEADSMERVKNAVFSRKVDIIFNVEYVIRNDDLHFRGSGLNEALLRKAHERDISIGFSVSDIGRLKSGFERAKILGRMMQNVRLCRKFKVRMTIASLARNKWEMRHAPDLLAFARVLGMTGKEAKEALLFTRKSS